MRKQRLAQNTALDNENVLFYVFTLSNVICASIILFYANYIYQPPEEEKVDIDTLITILGLDIEELEDVAEDTSFATKEEEEAITDYALSSQDSAIELDVALLCSAATTVAPLLSSASSASTFSIDVDNASYTYTRKQLSMGYLPLTDNVRSEEFINYFSYDYPVPQNDLFHVESSINAFS